MSTRRPSKRKRLALTSQTETIQPPTISVQAETFQPEAMDQSKTNETVQSISAAVTALVSENLKASGLLPKPTDASNKAATASAAVGPTSQNEGMHDQNNDSSSIPYKATVNLYVCIMEIVYLLPVNGFFACF